ncbi:2OG-Fe(II) oxygenase [Tahibacter amnicola]|uniref:2OG-Fe(II) oxygenase n=1 Tax=Tahibacter amnicola TaxID=2976241 RepID=A0ABY6BD79_9GAMM|nr:2OG-Fe(II) oxygenase family protein [Tahibacter amnicola]UXI68001.1 2OG-Fe(II) oxygenase [Tahibacter amnicola]
MFNPAVDFGPWQARLRASGRVLIPDALDPALTGALAQALADVADWDLAIRDGDTSRLARAGETPAEARAAMIARAAADARGRYAFAYDSCMLVERYLAGHAPGSLLHRLVDMLHAPPVLQFIRELVGDPAIRRVLVQATRYLPGHFLRRHDDTNDPGQDRRYAFVINLGRDWQADWGGLLQFLDAEGNVVDTFVPRFNSLSLFRVPQSHAVSLVAPWAEQPRHALTGWFMA